ncbi:MAG: hypothetical protein ACOZBW_06325 [Thermodesulfobacteriota bacterium]
MSHSDHHHGHDHDHHHGHHDHDHDSHHHHHEAQGGTVDLSAREKLTRLFDYWLRHNESHGDSYNQWIVQAEQEGLHDTAAILREIADLTRKVTEKIQAGAATLKK